MRGLMMDRPLLISSLIEYAARYHRHSEIVSRTVEGGFHRYGWADCESRAKQVANALRRLGIEFGDRVGTIAWNTYRHLELYFGISGIGAVCHTINPRLFPDQIRYIVNHAEDKLLFVDLTFVPLVEKLAPVLAPVRHFIVMTDKAHMPSTSLPNVLCYEELLAAESPDLVWPEFDEHTAGSLCYTSGTTGNPKGSLYTHRSTVLHSFHCCMADFAAHNSAERMCPVVPMFHANAWGIPYSAAMCGMSLVMPGPALDGASLYELFEKERVTMSAGVPTIWLGLLNHVAEKGARFNHLKRTLIGGSAVPLAMIQTFENKYGVEVMHGWGMTEMSPIGTIGTLLPHQRSLSKEEQHAIKVKQGRAIYGVDLKVVGPDGSEQPHDGVSRGELLVRGPWIVSGYYNDPKATEAAVTPDGWFRTGDVVTIDAEGFVQIVDRAKDVIKSGGEWISSIDVENAAMGHDDVAEAAVIGLPHPKWGERPLIIIVPKQGRTPAKESILAYLAKHLAKWQLPDDVVFVKEIPHTATGKILKTKLRELYQEHKLPEAAA